MMEKSTDSGEPIRLPRSLYEHTFDAVLPPNTWIEIPGLDVRIMHKASSNIQIVVKGTRTK